jgi:hypothetical protein
MTSKVTKCIKFGNNWNEVYWNYECRTTGVDWSKSYPFLFYLICIKVLTVCLIMRQKKPESFTSDSCSSIHYLTLVQFTAKSRPNKKKRALSSIDCFHITFLSLKNTWPSLSLSHKYFLSVKQQCFAGLHLTNSSVSVNCKLNFLIHFLLFFSP